MKQALLSSTKVVGSDAAETFCTAQIIVYYRDGNEVGTKNGRLRFQQGRAGDVFSLMLVTGLLGLDKNQ
jgi:hypothetical protein